MVSIQLMVVGMTVPLLVLEVATLAELGLLGRISIGMCVSLTSFPAHLLGEVASSVC